MLEYDHIGDLLKAASRRMDDALELLELPSRERARSDAGHRHLCGAQYLAGYAVECALKSYIIYLTSISSARRVQHWSTVLGIRQAAAAIPDLSGRRSHNLSLLLQAAELEAAVTADVGLSLAWALCRRWTPALRYRPTPPASRAETVETVEACRTVQRWVRARFTM